MFVSPSSVCDTNLTHHCIAHQKKKTLPVELATGKPHRISFRLISAFVAEKLVKRVQDGLGSQMYKPVDYEHLKALAAKKKQAGNEKLLKVNCLLIVVSALSVRVLLDVSSCRPTAPYAAWACLQPPAFLVTECAARF